MITKVWYGVMNGGDGSAHPVFCDTEDLAVYMEENQYEGWGECCVGSLTIEHDGPITLKRIETAGSVLAEKVKDNDTDLLAFVDRFFDETPYITVAAGDSKWFHIYVDGEYAADRLAYPSRNEECTPELAAQLEKLFNSRIAGESK